MSFVPVYQITPSCAAALMRIESVRTAMEHLPVTPELLAGLRESARLHSTHYSTMIEGNRLTGEEVEQVLEQQGHFPGRERDEKEVLGYYAALGELERMVLEDGELSEAQVQRLHALTMGTGRTGRGRTTYRDGQNVIRDAGTRRMVYLPPDANDVPRLMKELFIWINQSMQTVPIPLVASIAHYQFATIHPYYDGNGRTARLLTTLILHRGGYSLKGLYSLEEYYARNLPAYYAALSIGPSHNYYLGRAEADISPWVVYFCGGMAESFEAVVQRSRALSGEREVDRASVLRKLSPRQRRALDLLHDSETITANAVATLFGIKPRAARNLCHRWVSDGFLEIQDSANRSRCYKLTHEWHQHLF